MVIPALQPPAMNGLPSTVTVTDWDCGMSLSQRKLTRKLRDVGVNVNVDSRFTSVLNDVYAVAWPPPL